MGKSGVFVAVAFVVVCIGTSVIITDANIIPKKANSNNNCPKPPQDGSFHPQKDCEGVRLIDGQKCKCKCAGATKNPAASGWYCPSSSASSTTSATTTSGGSTTAGSTTSGNTESTTAGSTTTGGTTESTTTSATTAAAT